MLRLVAKTTGTAAVSIYFCAKRRRGQKWIDAGAGTVVRAGIVRGDK